jgi:uncharacterized protein YbjT (DUF2867 family)
MDNPDISPMDAVVIGATGLVGKQIVQQLLQHASFKSVLILVRRSSGLQHAKLKEVIIDFSKPEEWSREVKGHVLFSALGTTILQAGSQEAQYVVDYTYQVNVAEAAAKNNVGKYALVSSVGANPASRFFYTRMKGELETTVNKLPFRQMDIFQPGFLDGGKQRKDTRPLEKAGVFLTKGLNAIGLFNKYKPIKGQALARAMIRAVLKDNPGYHVWKLGEIFKMVKGE